MDNQQKLVTNFDRYEQVLNTVFGAAFGIIGSVSITGRNLSRELLYLVLFFILAAMLSLWVVSAASKFGRTISQSKQIKWTIVLTAFFGLLLSCVVILVASEALKDMGVATHGPELSAVLVAWTTCYFITGFWVALQGRLG